MSPLTFKTCHVSPPAPSRLRLSQVILAGIQQQARENALDALSHPPNPGQDPTAIAAATSPPPSSPSPVAPQPQGAASTPAFLRSNGHGLDGQGSKGAQGMQAAQAGQGTAVAGSSQGVGNADQPRWMRVATKWPSAQASTPY